MKYLFWAFLFFSSFAGAITEREAIKLLIQNQNMPLDTDKHAGCSSDTGKTIGDYLAFLLSTVATAEKTDKRWLKVECGPWRQKDTTFDPPKDKKTIDCLFTAHVEDKAGETPWNFALRFRLKGKGIDPNFLACPGT